jgi:hypothetical protein
MWKSANWGRRLYAEYCCGSGYIAAEEDDAK